MVDSTDLWFSLLDDLHSAIPGGLQHCTIDYANRSCSWPMGGGVSEFAGSQLLRSILKKFKDEIDQEKADTNAFALFQEVNEVCRNWKLRVDLLGPYDDVALGEFQKTLWDFFNPNGYPLLSHAGIERHVDFGPGSAPGADGTSFLEKIGSSVLTASRPMVANLYHQWCASHPLRIDCEIARSLSFGPPEVCSATKLVPVLKTTEISRLVKTEPSLNMFFQKGIGGLLVERLWTYFGTSLVDQPGLNARMAAEGSIAGKFATIDLKSASDLIAREFCRKFIPKADFGWLDLLRSTHAITPDGTVELHMMCTMGNGFCFPLQTAIFSSVVWGAYKALGIPIRKDETVCVFDKDEETGEIINIRSRQTLPNWGVFGDDIVVVDEAYELVMRLLRALGFVPNTAKSFSRQGILFRESCGTDCYNGVNVRGVYCKTLLTQQSRYTLINNLTDWSASTGIPLPGTIKMLLKSVQRVEVPPWENPDSGIRMPSNCVKSANVFQADTQVLGIRPYSGMIRPSYQGSFLYKKFVPVVIDDDVSRLYEVDDDDNWSISDKASEKSRRRWGANPTAIVIAALKGTLRDGRVGFRVFDSPTYRLRVCVAPCWDYIPPGHKTWSYWSSWRRMAWVYYGA